MFTLMACNNHQNVQKTRHFNKEHHITADHSDLKLSAIIKRDALFFKASNPPKKLIDHLAKQKVIFIGEHHYVREHHDLLVSLLKTLHHKGTRHLFIEAFQSYGPLVNSYVLGENISLPPLYKTLYGPLLEGIRTYNKTLSSAEQIQVHSIDIDHRSWAFPTALVELQKRYGKQTHLSTFLKNVGWPQEQGFSIATTQFKWHPKDSEKYVAHLQKLIEACQANPRNGEPDYLTLAKYALVSFQVREVWRTKGEQHAHPAREEAIKKMVGLHLAKTSGPVLINMGGFHGQLKHLLGTQKTWVGQYLAEQNPSTKGKTISIFVNATRWEKKGKKGDIFSANKGQPELMSALSKQAGPNVAFLPLKDPYFKTKTSQVSYLGRVVHHKPREQFHAYILLPKATFFY